MGATLALRERGRRFVSRAGEEELVRIGTFMIRSAPLPPLELRPPPLAREPGRSPAGGLFRPELLRSRRCPPAFFRTGLRRGSPPPGPDSPFSPRFAISVVFASPPPTPLLDRLAALPCF